MLGYLIQWFFYLQQDKGKISKKVNINVTQINNLTFIYSFKMLGYLIQKLHHLQLDKNKINKKADAKLQLVTSQRLDYLIQEMFKAR